MPHQKRVQASPDYFGEALRILDNDITLAPQREHLTALWGLVIGLSRRLTQARVEYQDYQCATMRKHCPCTVGQVSTHPDKEQ